MFMVSENFVSKLTNLKYNILNQLAIIQSQHKYSISDYKKLPEEEQEKIKKICDAIEEVDFYMDELDDLMEMIEV